MAQHNDREYSIVESIRRNLVEFGYRDLTFDHVKASYDKAMAGEEPVGIIDMMTRTQLEKNGLLPK